MSFAKEFKEFAVQGNMVDMAVGIIIGGAFNPMVQAFVSDILMPPLGLLLGKVDFKDLYVTLQPGQDGLYSYPNLEAAHTAGAVTLNYGHFINTVVSFVILSLALFMLVKVINRLRRVQKAEEAAETPPTAAA